jgi:hypothetical protein
MPVLPMGRALLEPAGMSDDNIIHFNPWRDFNDAAPLHDPFAVEPDADQIARFVDVVFGYSEGLIPVRGFVDKGQGKDGRPHNIWIEADATAPEKLTTFAGWASREGAAVYVIPGTVAETGQARAADVLQMQSLVVDLDSGDIPAKLDHLLHHLGRPTLIVESGGRTPEGVTKLHVWWKLTEPAEGADLDRLCQLRGEIALKVGGDTHFRSAHQPIRVPGTVYHKGGLARLVQIRKATELEVDLAEMAERVADMPPMPGIGMATAEPREKPAIADVLATPVHEGGTDDWSRFEGASAAIGYFLRLVHEGRISMDEGWTAICGYNAAMLRPSWPLDRLKRETNRLWELHIKRHGPPLIRLDSAAPAQTDLPTFTLGALLDDTSPMPDDIIGPRVLTPGGLLVLGGAPKVGKSDLLIALLVHMAAGVPFLGFTPPRPLRIFYLQAEIQYHYLRERMQQIGLPRELIASARDNLIVTPKLRMLLDAEGSARVAEAIRAAFPDEPLDILCVDPIRNLFDGGPDGGGENDNAAMMFFLKDRVEVLRDHVNPDCGVILVHHTKKLSKHQVKEDPFLALSGASALRGFYTTGLILHRPDEEASERRLEIELRNGPALPAKVVDKVNGTWTELTPSSERLVRKDLGARHDAERDRKNLVVLGLIFDEAAEGRLYTATQFAEAFENQHDLGGRYSIRERLSVLGTKGQIKFRRNFSEQGFPGTQSHFGYLVVRDMRFGRDPVVDAETGEVLDEGVAVLPTHYKCPHSGRAREVENPSVWVYPEEAHD